MPHNQDLQVEYDTSGQTFVKNRIGSTEKAAQQIGFKADVDLEEGLSNLIKWRDREV